MLKHNAINLTSVPRQDTVLLSSILLDQIQKIKPDSRFMVPCGKNGDLIHCLKNLFKVSSGHFVAYDRNPNNAEKTVENYPDDYITLLRPQDLVEENKPGYFNVMLFDENSWLDTKALDRIVKPIQFGLNRNENSVFGAIFKLGREDKSILDKVEYKRKHYQNLIDSFNLKSKHVSYINNFASDDSVNKVNLFLDTSSDIFSPISNEHFWSQDWATRYDELLARARMNTRDNDCKLASFIDRNIPSNLELLVDDEYLKSHIVCSYLMNKFNSMNIHFKHNLFLVIQSKGCSYLGIFGKISRFSDKKSLIGSYLKYAPDKLWMHSIVLIFTNQYSKLILSDNPNHDELVGPHSYVNFAKMTYDEEKCNYLYNSLFHENIQL